MADGDSVLDIEALVRANDDFRREVRTTEHSQIVLMTIPPEGEIGDEVHDGIDQTLVFEEGEAEAVIAGESFPVRRTGRDRPRRDAAQLHQPRLRPAPALDGVRTAQHAPGTVHHTKAEADAAEEAH